MTLPRNLLQATANDVQALITGLAAESQHLDFKRDLPRSDAGARHELLADISAFANSSGGDVVYGIQEDGEGRASETVPQSGNADAEVLRIQDVLMNGVEPRIPGLQVHSIAVPGGFVVVVRVPQSWAGPHRVKSNQHFFTREGARKRQLDIPEIRSLFLRSENQSQRVRDFRTERIGKIISGNAPHNLVAGPLLIVHLIPTQAALGAVNVDPVIYSRTRSLPALGVTIPGARLNLDGALGIRNPGHQGTHGYSQFFRNGFFETVKVLTGRRTDGRVNLPSLSYEQEIIALLERFRVELTHLQVGHEMTCMLSITDADTVGLGLNPADWLDGENQGIFDRRTLVLPDVLLSADVAAAKALRPVFDLVWQSAGIDQSVNYDQNGEWATLP